ncbi:MAG: hypothetical protein L3J73_04565, partial [Thermoplasmata archaeon]|nr:hypothetical protein [Thermoplasmata archaeon]
GNHFVAGYEVDLLSISTSGGTVTNATVGSISALSFLPFPSASLAADRSVGSPYFGRLYAVWSNGTALSGGSPASVFARSLDHGATWSSATNLSDRSSALDCCSVASVGANGSLVVAWYGLTGTVSPEYRLSATTSFDGGADFSPEFGVDGWTGNATNALTPPALAARGDSAEVVWTQFRSATPVACPACVGGTASDRELDHATIVVGTIAATVPVNLSVTGIASAGATLSVGPAPVRVAGIGGLGFTLTAPATFLVAGTTYYFSVWFGSALGTAPVFNNVWEVGTALSACYVTVQGSPCHATGAPGTLEVQVAPVGANVTAGGLPVALHTGRGSILLPSGRPLITAVAPGYAMLSTSVEITPGNTTWLNLSLSPLPGLLEGNVTPSTARVIVDGSSIPVAANGSFSVAEATGTHTVTANAYGYFANTTTVAIGYAVPTVLVIVLVWDPAHIIGFLAPVNASLLVDGAPVDVSPTGTFTLNLSGGAHSFAAQSWSYNAFQETVDFYPGEFAPLGIHLVPANGTIRATVTPPTASVTLDGASVPTPDGLLTISVPWGPHQLGGSASGYSPNTTVVVVPFDGVVSSALSLPIAPGWISGSVRPINASLWIDGSRENVSGNGTFNRSVAAGDHAVLAEAPGFANLSVELLVVPGRANSSAFELAALPTAPPSMTAPLTLASLTDGLVLDAAVLLWIGELL